MRAKQLLGIQKTKKSRAKIWRQKNAFTPPTHTHTAPVALAAVRSKAVVLLLMYCFM